MTRPSLAAAMALTLAACGGEEARPPVVPPPPPPLAVVTPNPDADPPPLTDGDVTVGRVSGIHVIVRRVPGAEFTAGQLYVRGGARNWTAANAGIEKLALTVAASGGTRTLDKTAFARKLASLGATIHADPRNDFSALALKAPRAAWDDTFALLVEVLRAPSLPPSEIELARQQSLAELHHELEDPDGRLWTLERKQIFAGHPYANRPTGSLESMSALKADDLVPYLDRLRERGRLLFVAAGDVDPVHVFDQVKRALGDLPQGNYAETPMPPVAFDKARLTTEERKLPTNYIEVVFTMPTWQDPDFLAGRVAMDALSYRLWEEVRSKRNLAYAVNAHFNERFARPIGTLYVTAVDPNAAMRVMLDEARRLAREPLSDTELAGYRAVFLTGYLQDRETSEGQAAALGDAELYGGDWHLARTLADRVRSLGADAVQAFAQKYLVRMQAAVVGDPGKVDAALFTSM